MRGAAAAAEPERVRRLPATTVYVRDRVLRSHRLPRGFTVSAVYFVQEVGLNPLELVLLGTVMEATIFLFEIPTGVIADTYSRRLSLIIGCVVWASRDRDRR